MKVPPVTKSRGISTPSSFCTAMLCPSSERSLPPVTDSSVFRSAFKITEMASFLAVTVPSSMLSLPAASKTIPVSAAVMLASFRIYSSQVPFSETTWMAGAAPAALTEPDNFTSACFCSEAVICKADVSPVLSSAASFSTCTVLLSTSTAQEPSAEILPFRRMPTAVNCTAV